MHGDFGEDTQTAYDGSVPTSRRATEKRGRPFKDLEKGRQSPSILSRLVDAEERVSASLLFSELMIMLVGSVKQSVSAKLKSSQSSF